MSEQGARRLMSINSLKLVAGGVSLLAFLSAQVTDPIRLNCGSAVKEIV